MYCQEEAVMDLKCEGYIDAVLNFNDINKWLSEARHRTGDCEDHLPYLIKGKPSQTNGVVNSVLATEEQGTNTASSTSMACRTAMLICARVWPGARTGAVLLR